MTDKIKVEIMEKLIDKISKKEFKDINSDTCTIDVSEQVWYIQKENPKNKDLTENIQKRNKWVFTKEYKQIDFGQTHYLWFEEHDMLLRLDKHPVYEIQSIDLYTLPNIEIIRSELQPKNIYELAKSKKDIGKTEAIDYLLKKLITQDMSIENTRMIMDSKNEGEIINTINELIKDENRRNISQEGHDMAKVLLTLIKIKNNEEE